MSLDFVIMTLQQSNGNVRASNLLCQLDTKNETWLMGGGGGIPDDAYDLFSIGWITPVPNRTDVFVDQATNTKYQVYGNPKNYGDHLELAVTRYSGVTP